MDKVNVVLGWRPDGAGMKDGGACEKSRVEENMKLQI